jgi:hypothetical protein
MRVKLIRTCPKFAYPAGYEFELDDHKAAYWTHLGYMVAMGATPMQISEKPQEDVSSKGSQILDNHQRNKRKRR